MSFAKKFLVGSSLNAFDQGIRLVSVFIMTPVIVHSLGVAGYGVWILLMSVFRHFALMDFGLSSSVSRFFARAIGKEDSQQLNTYFNTAVNISLYTAGLSFVLVGIIYFLCPVFFESIENLEMIRTIVAIYGAYVSIGFLARAFRALLKSHLRYDILVLASTVQIVVGNGLIFFFLTRGHGLLTLAILTAVAGLLEYLIIVAGAFKVTPLLRLNRALVDRAERREFLGYSATSFCNMLGQSLRFTIDPIVLASFVGVSSVTFYNIGARFPQYARDFVGAIMGSQMLVILSRLHGRGEEERMKRTFLQATRFSTILAVLGGFSMVFYGEQFLLRWMGPGFESSYRVLVLLAIPNVFVLMQYPSLNLFYTIAKHGHLAVIHLAGGVFNIILSLILVQSLGLYGVVWATCIEMTFVFLLVIPQSICRLAGLSVRSFYLESLLSPAVKTLLVLLPMVFFRYLLQPTYLSIGLFAIVQGLYLIPLFYFVVLNRKDRDLVGNTLRNLFRRI